MIEVHKPPTPSPADLATFREKNSERNEELLETVNIAGPTDRAEPENDEPLKPYRTWGA